MTSDPVQAQVQWFRMASIIDMACHRLGLSVNHYFQRFLEFGKWELIQLKLDRSNEIKTVLLPISDVNTCTLPPDCIDVVKVGIQVGQFVQTIGVNDKLSQIDRTTDAPVFSQSVSPGYLPNGTAIQSYGGGAFMNYGGLSLPAIGGSLPHEGHFKLISKPGSKELYLDGNIGCTEMYVEYISLGISPCSETVLEPYIADYILKCILAIWETEMNPRRTESSIARRERDKAYAFSLVSGRTNDLSPDDLYNIVRAAYRLTNLA